MNKELKSYLDKEDFILLSDFKWGDQGSNEFLKFIKLVREELNYPGNFNFIRMINNYTGEVKQTDACETGLRTLLDVLDDEIDLYSTLELFEGRNPKEDIAFEGNTLYIDKLNEHLKQKF